MSSFVKNVIPALTMTIVLSSSITPSTVAQKHDKHHMDEAAHGAVSAVLDSLHSKASQADFDAYFGLYTGDAIFLGTDATERWTIEEFKEYARPHFSQGRGWTYHPIDRHIYVSSDGSTAWFDESLENASLGLTRGSGVLSLVDGHWKVAQYNLTIPIPNDLALEVVEKIRAVDQ